MIEMIGFVIKKSRDLYLNQRLFWQIYDEGVINWINKNYLIENEDYGYCVVRENIKLVYDCLIHNIPFFIDLDRKEGNPKTQNVFDIKVGNDAEWFDLFKLDRIVKSCKKNELINYPYWFFKTKKKGFAYKGLLDYVNQNCQGYGKWCYPLEDKGIDIGDFLNNPLFYKEVIIDMLPDVDYIMSEMRKFGDETRVIFKGQKVISIASKHDYKNEAKPDIFFENFAKKYGDKVPYLIWSVDFSKRDIVEAHLHCDLLGKFYGNQEHNLIIK